jgi:hypothetical protein
MVVDSGYRRKYFRRMRCRENGTRETRAANEEEVNARSLSRNNTVA